MINNIKKLVIPKSPEIGFVQIDAMIRKESGVAIITRSTAKNWHVTYRVKQNETK